MATYTYTKKELLYNNGQALSAAWSASSTKQLYESVQKQYLQFCQSYGLVSLPASEQTLLMYIALLYIRGLKASTVKVYLSSIRSLHIEAGLDSPSDNNPRIRQAIRSIEINQPPASQKATHNITHCAPGLYVYT